MFCDKCGKPLDDGYTVLRINKYFEFGGEVFTEDAITPRYLCTDCANRAGRWVDSWVGVDVKQPAL